MITASPSRLGRLFWETFSRISIGIRFRELIYLPDSEVDKSRSMLLLGNHISWWDGFFPMEINRKFFEKNYHVMMLEKELKIRPFMRKGGAFSVNPGNRSIVESLNYAAQLLENPDNLVLLFPQGAIHSIYENPIVFQSGIERIIEKCTKPIQIVFYAVLMDFGSRPRPELRFYTTIYQGDSSSKSLNKSYNRFYESCLEKQKKTVIDNN